MFEESIDKLKLANKISNSDPNIVNYLHYLSIEQNIDSKKALMNY